MSSNTSANPRLSKIASATLFLLTSYLLFPSYFSIPLSTPPSPYHITIPFKHHVKMLPLKLTTTRSEPAGSVFLDWFLPSVKIISGDVNIKDSECTVGMSGDLTFPSLQYSSQTSSLTRSLCSASTMKKNSVKTSVHVSVYFLELLHLNVYLNCESMLETKVMRNKINVQYTKCYITSIQP